MQDKKIVIDTETTGLDSDTDELLQVSIIDEYGNTLYNQHFKPQRTTSWKQAQAVNGISPEMVKDCPSIKSELPKIQSIINSANTIIGYNHEYFDFSFLVAAGVVIPENAKIIDIMPIFAEIYGVWNDYYGAYKWQNLTTCAYCYGYDWGNDVAHDSLSDCRATLYCYQKMTKDFEVYRGVLKRYSGRNVRVAIPSISSDGEKITKIGYAAFKNCTEIKSIKISDSVTEIGSYAFENCTELISIIIPYSVTEIGSCAFGDCSSLEIITIPSGVKSIKTDTFSCCEKLKGIIIPNGVTEIGDYAFSDCSSLENIIISDSVTEIGDGAFKNCVSLKSITIPDGVTKINDFTFQGCKSLESVKLPKGIKIGSWAFDDCPKLQKNRKGEE